MKARIKTSYPRYEGEPEAEFKPIADLVEGSLQDQNYDSGALETLGRELDETKHMLAQLVAMLFEQKTISKEQLETFIKTPHNGEIEYE